MGKKTTSAPIVVMTILSDLSIATNVAVR